MNVTEQSLEGLPETWNRRPGKKKKEADKRAWGFLKPVHAKDVNCNDNDKRYSSKNLSKYKRVHTTTITTLQTAQRNKIVGITFRMILSC